MEKKEQKNRIKARLNMKSIIAESRRNLSKMLRVIMCVSRIPNMLRSFKPENR